MIDEGNIEVFLVQEASDGTEIRIGIKKDTRELPVNGDPVVTRRELSLSNPQKTGAFFTVVSVCIGAFWALLQIIDWFRVTPEGQP